MALPVEGKQYLVVFCKSCTKGFRVRPDALYEGKRVEITAPERLKCRSCGFEAVYEPFEMKIANLRKGTPPRK